MKKGIVAVIVAIVIIGGAAYAYSRSSSTSTPVASEADGNSDTDMAIDMTKPMDQTTTTNPESVPNTGQTTTTTNPDIGGSTTTPPSTVGSVKEFTVTAENFAFSPKTLSVSKGDQVKIIFKNMNGFHDFKIDEFNVATAKIQGGSEEAVTFTADKAGSFQYYCSVGQHRAMGMWGTLTVK